GIPSVYSHRPSFEFHGEDFHLIMGGQLIQIWITDDEDVVVKRYGSPDMQHLSIEGPINKKWLDARIRMWGPPTFERYPLPDINAPHFFDTMESVLRWLSQVKSAAYQMTEAIIRWLMENDITDPNFLDLVKTTLNGIGNRATASKLPQDIRLGV